MKLGIYIHYPYCVQRCPYCDFATYERSQIPPSEHYLNLLSDEARALAPFVKEKQVATVFFGGGTPSLMPPHAILNLLEGLTTLGFELLDDGEVTIEINPGTVGRERIKELLAAGVNRFSVGAQTFNEDHLKRLGRRHSVEDTVFLLNQLQEQKLNYSFDLMYGLPGQSLGDLRADLDRVLAYRPPHVSLYNLNVADNNPLNQGRPADEVQAEMFYIIRKRLSEEDYDAYELSNFARDGLYSKHNKSYWNGAPYWGLGLGAHGYIAVDNAKTTESKPEQPNEVDGLNLSSSHRQPNRGFDPPIEVEPTNEWGIRYWKPRRYGEYESWVKGLKDATHRNFTDAFTRDSYENLLKHEALTDYLYTRLRTKAGFSLESLEEIFGLPVRQQLDKRLERLLVKNWLRVQNSQVTLSEDALIISNRIFTELCFTADDLLSPLIDKDLSKTIIRETPTSELVDRGAIK